jgi:uncharacterized protein (TIGR03437 family)
VLCLALWIASGATAATSAFLLGVDYSEWLNPNPVQIATDRSGALYILSAVRNSSPPPPSLVTKLSADGKTILWQNNPGFAVQTMAVDPNGGVYVIPAWPGDLTSTFVAKLSAGGTGVAWKLPVGSILGSGAVVAADSNGRAYVTGVCTTNSQTDPSSLMACVVRLNAAGSAVDYTARVKGSVTSLAVDGSGAAFVAGQAAGVNASFLARVAPDGSTGFYSTMRLRPGLSTALALDANGDAVLYTSGVLQRFDSTGNATLSTTIPSELGPGGGFALDADGNAYIGGFVDQLYQVKNNLAACGWNPPPTAAVGSRGADLLSVLAPDGSPLQTTYIPGGWGGALLVATGPNSTVFVVDAAGASFVPTQAGPFPAGTSGTSFLWRISPKANAQIVPLACLGNAAGYATGPIAPGEIVTLFGNGLGPEHGVQTQATLQSPFPTQAANVEVTFDGTPAPLLWVQASQINVVAPWSLTPGQTTQVCASFNGVKTNCLSWPVVEASMAVFTVDGVYAAALNQDGTINSAENPAALGTIVSVFATGLGPIFPAQANGTLVGLPLPNNVLPVGVEARYVTDIFLHPGSTPFEVMYAGPAPYLVAGVSQINFRTAQYPVEQGQIYLVRPSGVSPGFRIYLTGQ